VHSRHNTTFGHFSQASPYQGLSSWLIIPPLPIIIKYHKTILPTEIKVFESSHYTVQIHRLRWSHALRITATCEWHISNRSSVWQVGEVWFCLETHLSAPRLWRRSQTPSDSSASAARHTRFANNSDRCTIRSQYYIVVGMLSQGALLCAASLRDDCHIVYGVSAFSWIFFKKNGNLFWTASHVFFLAYWPRAHSMRETLRIGFESAGERRLVIRASGFWLERHEPRLYLRNITPILFFWPNTQVFINVVVKENRSDIFQILMRWFCLLLYRLFSSVAEVPECTACICI
jgi:hypothetical protein